LGHLTRKNPSPYDLYVFGGTLSLTQSINHMACYKFYTAYIILYITVLHTWTDTTTSTADISHL